MSELKVKARVKQVFPVETKGNFSFATLWATVDYDSQYPQVIEVQAGGQKAALFAHLKEGDEVELYFNLRGREWNKDGQTKVFNTISVWRVDKLGSVQPPQPTTTACPNGDPQIIGLPF